MKAKRFALTAVVILFIFASEISAKSRVKGKSHTKTNRHKVLKHQTKGKKGDATKDEAKRQFINRPKIRYFGNRPYIWMKPSPLTQRTIVTTHIPRPPLALPYSARIIRLLASKYPSGLYGRQMVPQAYPGYGGLPQGSMFGPHMNGLHGEGVEGADGMMHGFGDEDGDG